jgi:hypothetical protein
MAYSTNPNLPKARATALQLLIREGLPLQVVANRCGVNRTTIWRWKRKWDKLNEYVQLTNDNWSPGRALVLMPSITVLLLGCLSFVVPSSVVPR